MINKEKVGLFIVMFCLLFFIIKLHKKHFEQFRLLNCDLSKSDSKFSDEDYVCCVAKNFLKDNDEGHPNYSYHKNIWDQCTKISTIDISLDKLIMSDRDAYYDSLEIIYNNLEAEYNSTLFSYSNAQATYSNLTDTYNTESNIYNDKLTKYAASNTEYETLSNINSNLNEMTKMHEYKLALRSLDDVINNEVKNDMGIGIGLKDKETDIQNMIQNSLQKAFDYIPNLTNLYIHNVRLYESIEKTRGLAYNETHANDTRENLIANIENSRLLYANSITLLNKSEVSLFTISESIKELSNYIYQTSNGEANYRDITINDTQDGNIVISFQDGKYNLPASILVDGMIGAEYISEFLFKQCSINPITNIASCANLPINGEEPLEGDIPQEQEYKKQKINEDNPLSSTFFSSFLRYMRRENIIEDEVENVENALDKTFKYVFLLKTFSNTETTTETEESTDT